MTARASYPMMNISSLVRLSAAVGFTLLVVSPTAAASDDAVLREPFRRALEQVERGLAVAPDEERRLREYRLHPYLEAARLTAALRRAPGTDTDRAVIDFLRAHAQLPVARELRRDWLLNLAEREAWSMLLSHYDAGVANSALSCQHYRARIETDPSETLARELAEYWQTAPQMPQSCVAPFDWLKARGMLTPDVVERRARKALEDGNLELSSWLLRMLPAERAAPLQQWERLLRDPARELEAIAAQRGAPFEWAALLDGFSRVARRDPDRAKAILQRLERERFKPEQYAQLQRWVALGLAWDRRADAIEWFRTLPESVADELVLEWRVRSALWNDRLDLAAMWLHGLPDELAGESRWIYWRARSMEALGRTRQSTPIFETLARDNGYYSLLSSWRLGRAHVPRARPFEPDLVAQSELLERPAMLRARELHLIGRSAWANAEWREATRDLDAAMRLQAAWLASHWGWHVQAVPLLVDADALDMLELSYPDAYVGTIRRHAEAVDLAPEWIYGVMRQESLFDPRAVSPSNAYGLLQLLLPTAREVARRRGDRAPSVTDLFRPEVNIPLGATYLSEMRRRFDGQLIPALAAYNAGPNAVARWLPQRPMAPDFWIENVPYNQTRSYVQRVFWHIAAHGWRSTGEPQDLSPLLQPVRTP